MGRIGWSAAVVLGLCAVVGLVGGCATPSSSPASSVRATATAVSTLTTPSLAAIRTFPPSQTPIERGTYRWTGFEPAITIEVGSGWEPGHDHPGFFDLFRGSDFPSVSFARFTDVYTDGTIRRTAADAATVVASLDGRHGVTLSAQEPIDLGGLTGQGFDLTVTGPQTPLFRGPAGDFKMDPGFVNRYHVLDVPDGGVLVIGIHANDGDIDAATALADPILASFAVER